MHVGVLNFSPLSNGERRILGGSPAHTPRSLGSAPLQSAKPGAEPGVERIFALPSAERTISGQYSVVMHPGYCIVPAVFGHFLDPHINHPRGAIFPTVDSS